MKQKLLPYYLSITLALVLMLAGAFQLRGADVSLVKLSNPALAFFGISSGEVDEKNDIKLEIPPLLSNDEDSEDSDKLSDWGPPITGDKHKECVIERGGFARCNLVDGAGRDQCSCDAECAGERPRVPASKHTECIEGACVVVDGVGVGQCNHDSDCLNNNKVNNFVANSLQRIYITMTTVMQNMWTSLMNFLF